MKLKLLYKYFLSDQGDRALEQFAWEAATIMLCLAYHLPIKVTLAIWIISSAIIKAIQRITR